MKKKLFKKVQKPKKNLALAGIEPTAELVNHSFVYVVLTGMYHMCRDYLLWLIMGTLSLVPACIAAYISYDITYAWAL